jgi:hypothetical protein
LAVAFDGVDDYIHLGNNLPFNQNISGLTLSAWIQADYIVDSQTTDRNWIISISAENFGFPTTNSRAAMCLLDSDDARIIGKSYDEADPAAELRTEDGPIVLGQWYYLTGVIDYPADEMSIYIDGVLAITSYINFDNLTSPDTPSATSAIGSQDDGSGEFFSGALDEVRITKASRSSAWIAAQYDAMVGDFVTFGDEELLAP